MPRTVSHTVSREAVGVGVEQLFDAVVAEDVLPARPTRFEYWVDRFTGPFGRVVDHAIGSWEFTETGAGSAFRWTYTFTARGERAGALLKIGVPIAWARYMAQCAEQCVGLVVKPATR